MTKTIRTETKPPETTPPAAPAAPAITESMTSELLPTFWSFVPNTRASVVRNSFPAMTHTKNTNQQISKSQKKTLDICHNLLLLILFIRLR